MNGPVVTTYYTHRYAGYADQLRRSCDRHGLDHDIAQIEDRGSWSANCHHKPVWLLRAMTSHPNRAVMWVDADAVFARPLPDDFLSRYGPLDIAHGFRPRTLETLSGTVLANPTSGARRLLEGWAATCELNPEMWDQDALRRAIRSLFLTQAVIVRRLHPMFCCIKGSEMGEIEAPVILHGQASRSLRDASWTAGQRLRSSLGEDGSPGPTPDMQLISYVSRVSRLDPLSWR